LPATKQVPSLPQFASLGFLRFQSQSVTVSLKSTSLCLHPHHISHKPTSLCLRLHLRHISHISHISHPLITSVKALHLRFARSVSHCDQNLSVVIKIYPKSIHLTSSFRSRHTSSLTGQLYPFLRALTTLFDTLYPSKSIFGTHLSLYSSTAYQKQSFTFSDFLFSSLQTSSFLRPLTPSETFTVQERKELGCCTFTLRTSSDLKY
jgi:hypothetical protein